MLVFHGLELPQHPGSVGSPQDQQRAGLHIHIDNLVKDFRQDRRYHEEDEEYPIVPKGHLSPCHRQAAVQYICVDIDSRRHQQAA